MNYKTYDETIKSLHSNSGEVFVISGGRRMKLADCRLDIDIIKHSVVYKARNPVGYRNDKKSDKSLLGKSSVVGFNNNGNPEVL